MEWPYGVTGISYMKNLHSHLPYSRPYPSEVCIRYSLPSRNQMPNWVKMTVWRWLYLAGKFFLYHFIHNLTHAHNYETLIRIWKAGPVWLPELSRVCLKKGSGLPIELYLRSLRQSLQVRIQCHGPPVIIIPWKVSLVTRVRQLWTSSLFILSEEPLLKLL